MSFDSYHSGLKQKGPERAISWLKIGLVEEEMVG